MMNALHFRTSCKLRTTLCITDIASDIAIYQGSNTFLSIVGKSTIVLVCSGNFAVLSYHEI